MLLTCRITSAKPECGGWAVDTFADGTDAAHPATVWWRIARADRENPLTVETVGSMHAPSFSVCGGICAA